MLRPMTPEDRDLVAAFYEGLSPESRTSRFLSPLPRVPGWLVDRLTAVDGDDHYAWLAVENGEAVGIAECHRLRGDPSACEVAITVADDWQHHGLGRRLVRELAREVAGHGIEGLAFTIEPTNHASAALARSLGAVLELEEGMLTGVAPLRVPEQAA